MSNHTIIGISGVTCAGKTTLAERLRNHLGTNCVLISQDQFYRSEDDPNHEWVELSPEKKHQNWENMSSIDWQTFTQTINQILEKREYQTSRHMIVLIEGHLIFNYRPIAEKCDKKIFLTLEKEECFARREARTHLPKDPDGYFDKWVWPMFISNFKLMKELQNNIPIEYFDGNCDQNIIFNAVIKSLEETDQK